MLGSRTISVLPRRGNQNLWNIHIHIRRFDRWYQTAAAYDAGDADSVNNVNDADDADDA